MELVGLEEVKALFSRPPLGLASRLIPGWSARLFLVGGAVRDGFLGLECPDLDLVLDGDPERPARDTAEALGASVFPLDEKRRIFRVVGEGWTLDLAPLKERDILADLKARDFTVNSIALEHTGEEIVLHDPLGGLGDLKEGLIRVSSRDSFLDDPLRILRGFRFFASFGWRMSADTLVLIWGAVDRLEHAARERVRDEIFRVLNSQRCFVTLMSMERYGVLFQVFPELKSLEGISQGRHHRVNLFAHTLFTVAGVETLERELPKPFGSHAGPVGELLEETLVETRTVRSLLKLAALYHDLGKPDTLWTDHRGDIHFYGHERVGAEKALAAAQSLMLSNREADLIHYLVRDHLRPGQLIRARATGGRGVARLFRPGQQSALMLLSLFAADHLAKGGGKTLEELRGPFAAWLDYNVSVLGQRRLKEPLVRGGDLLEIGFSPGPELGRVLRILNSLFWEGQLRDKGEALDMAKVYLEKQNS